MPAYPVEHLYTDLAVIGAGGAGLRAAAVASARGLGVTILSKVPPTRSHTVAAQGGINAALGNRTPDDWRWHMYDTLKGSDWLGDQDAIAFMCEQAPEAVVELEHMGMAFTRDETGHIYQRAYGGQRTEYGKGAPAYRACAVADRTGHALLHTLYAQAKRQGVQFLVEYIVLDLLIDAQGACRGVLAWGLEEGRIIALHAHATIIATGGFGQAWASTTSSSICTGDGGGMVLRAGLPLQDMEFVQFHPTSLYGTGILITEGARGEGAYLLNGIGERFLERYAPSSMELASRDIISRAMMKELAAGRGCGGKADHLHLSLSHLDPNVVREKLPSILEIARTFARIDALSAPIPVLPAVHFTMGGIASNAQCEVIDTYGNAVPGLMVVGEAGCNSVHGANRLGCNALLDLVVFGKVAGERAAGCIKPNQAHSTLPSSITDKPLARFDRLRHASGAISPNYLKKDMQRTMHSNAGIVREHITMAAGMKRLDSIRLQFEQELRVSDRSLIWNNDLIEALQTENLLLQAMVCLASALYRTESRGAHFRDDYPARDDAEWMQHTLATVSADGSVTLEKRPVRQLAGLSFPPEEREY